MRRFSRFACVDWSGARGERLQGMAIAVCGADGGAPRLVPAPAGRWSRPDVLAWLLDQAGEDMLIGADFSTALPFADHGAYFPGVVAMPADARGLWRHVEAVCAEDPHLAATSYVRHAELAPFFRVGAVTGTRFAGADRNGRLRTVERRRESGHPASCFNLVGARQVGRSSLTGMRVLHRIAGRLPVWPYDAVPAAGALLVEIYTGIAARAARVPGGRKIRDPVTLDTALHALGSAPHDALARYDDHSTDAMLTAAWLRRVRDDPALWMPAGLDAVRHTEGWTFGVP